MHELPTPVAAAAELKESHEQAMAQQELLIPKAHVKCQHEAEVFREGLFRCIGWGANRILDVGHEGVQTGVQTFWKVRKVWQWH